MRLRSFWLATLASAITLLLSPLIVSERSRATPGSASPYVRVAAGEQDQPAGPPAIPGLDGPIPQPLDGVPATPFVMTTLEIRTTGEIVAEQEAREAAGTPSPPPTARPEFEVPWRRQRPSNPASPDVSSWPLGAPDRASRPPLALTPGLTIEGPNLTQTGAYPPDTMGDIGPTQLFVALNGRMRVYDKATGAQQFDFTPDVFFSSTLRNGAATTDPRIRYDRLSGRWFIAYITIALPNRVVLAMSSGGTITAGTTWSFHAFGNTITNESGRGCLADYETLGIDAYALYIGVNQFCGTSIGTVSFFNTTAFLVNKAGYIAGTPSVAAISPLISDSVGGPFTPQGVDNIDPAPTHGYLVGVDALIFGQLSIIRITDPGGSPSAGLVEVNVPATTFPLNAPQSGGLTLDGLDDRLMNAVLRNGRIYAAHAIGVNASGTTTSPTRTAVRWYEIENLATTPLLRQSSTIFDNAASNPRFYWVPSINMNGSGDVVVGYAASSAVTFAGAAASHRLAADPLGTMQAPIALITGLASFNPPIGTPYRWGDYSMVSIDPTDDATFWTAQMYTSAANVYGTRAIRLTTLTTPTTVADGYTTTHDTPFAVPGPGVLGNDQSNGGGVLTAELVTTAANGVVTLRRDGSFSYTPNVGLVGADSFTYRATSSTGPGNVATVNVTVGSPLATGVRDAYGVEFNAPIVVPAPGVLDNDFANGGGGLTAALVTPTAHGTLSLAANGGFSYAPNAGYVGADSFLYQPVTAAGAGRAAPVQLWVGEGGPVIAGGVQPPTDLVVDVVAGDQVTVRFTAPVGGPKPTAFVLKAGRQPGEVVASLATGSVAPVFTFAAPPGTYYLRVHTVAGAAESGASNEVRLEVGTATPPSAPVNLVGLVQDATVALAWKHTYAGGVPTASILEVSGALEASVPLGQAERFTFPGVPPGNYTFRVRAANAAGFSSTSAPVTLTFPKPCSGAPQPPTAVVAYRVGPTISVLWDPAARGAAPTGFVVHVTGAVEQDLPTTARALSGVAPPGRYTLTVTATNGCGTSAPTAPQTVTMP